MTRRALVELIKRRIAGGPVSDDFKISDNEINIWIDKGIGFAASKSYNDSVASGEVGTIGDAFYNTFKDLVISLDANSGNYVCTLPSSPLSVPRGLDITTAYVQWSGRTSRPMIRLTPTQVTYNRELPGPKNALYFWCEGAKLYIDSYADLAGLKATVRMIPSNGTLTDQVNVGEDYMAVVIDYVMSKFMPTINIPQDLSNDSTNTK